MRILHLDAGREMRGGQWQVLRLIEGLRGDGVESTLLASPGSPLFESARRNGICVEVMGWIHAAAMARRHDVIHAHDARSHTVGALLHGAPLVVSRRVAFPIGRGAASQWKYRRAARYVAVSEYVRSVLLKGGVPEEKISVVYDGVPLIEPARADAGVLRVIAPANADDPQKGAPLAMEAARIAGVDVEFSSDLQSDLRHASMLVYVTHSEGLGSGALLAMSAGVPVVASRVGGLIEVVRDGENGLLVENDPKAIAAAMRRLLDDPASASRLGAAARQTIEERFTVSHMVRRTMEVYRQVLH